MTIRPSHADNSPERTRAARSNKVVSVAPSSALPSDAMMHPHAYRIALACWACFLAVFWVTFWVSSSAIFQIVIGTVYAVMFFGVPYEMSRIFQGQRKPAKSLWRFLVDPFSTLTGTMQGFEALLQMILVPVLLTLGGSAIGIIIRLARSGH